MVVILFSSAIVSVTSDKLYLGEARGNSCQSDNKSGGCGKKGQCSGRQKVEKNLREIGEEEGRALLAVTRCVSQSELSTG